MASRPVLHATTLAVLCAVYIALADNQLFWSAVFRTVDPLTIRGFAFTVTAFLLLSGSMALLFLLAGVRILFRPVLIFSLVLAAVIRYFGSSYGVIVEGGMVRNVFATDWREASELLTLSLAGHVLLFGVLPSLAVVFVHVRDGGAMAELRRRAVAVGIILAVTAAASLATRKDLVLIGREHKELRLTMNPLYAVYAAVKHAASMNRTGAVLAQVGGDARREAPRAGAERSVVVLVVGETARAREFSLNGYERDTNPLLEQTGAFSFPNTFACGTATAESLPCMFSFLDRGEFSIGRAAAQENVLDVLARAGVRVLWRDNNSGCKGVCARVGMEDLSNVSDRELCGSGECFDEVLLDRLEDRIRETGGDILIVLHQKGSHGPAYFRRHPAAFGVFLPECRSDAPQECPTSDIVNAYDNTVLYTDYFLNRTIALLQKSEASRNAMMLYVSDHGESLGEQGNYLHGMPYLLAPDEQKRVPFVLWMSGGFARDRKMERKCLSAASGKDYSHANIAHSLLGAFNVQTSVYQRERDILAACRADRML